MALYAIVQGNVVVDLTSTPDGVTVQELKFLTPEQKAAAVLVPDGEFVRVGFFYANGVFSAPPRKRE